MFTWVKEYRLPLHIDKVFLPSQPDLSSYDQNALSVLTRMSNSVVPQGINESANFRFLQRLSVIFGFRRECT